MQFNSRQQQFAFGKRMDEQLKNMTMSWNNEMNEWYPLAIKALDHSSIRTLEIDSKLYPELFEKDKHGIKVNVVAALANNLEIRRPAELGMTAEQFKDVLALNDEIGRQWEALVEPVRKKLEKEFQDEMKAAEEKAVADKKAAESNLKKVEDE